MQRNGRDPRQHNKDFDNSKWGANKNKHNNNNNGKSHHAFNKSNENVAMTPKPNNNTTASMDREQLAGFSPSLGNRNRYQPQSSSHSVPQGFKQSSTTTLNNNNNNNNNSRGFVAPRPYQNQSNHAPTIHGWSNNTQNTNNTNTQEEEEQEQQGEEIVDKSENTEANTRTVDATERDHNHNNRQDGNNEENDNDEDDDDKTLSKVQSVKLRKNPTLVIAAKKPQQQPKAKIDDLDVVSEATISDNDKDDDNQPVKEDDGGNNNKKEIDTNLIVKVSQKCLSRRIVFNRAKKPENLPKPVKMIDLTKQAANKQAAKSANNNSNNNDDDNDNDDDQEQDEVDPDDPLIVEPDFDLSGKDDMPPLEWKETRGPGAGLVNEGATCFVNAVLQCYNYLPPFAQYLQNQVTNSSNQQQQQQSPQTQDFLFMWAHYSRQMARFGPRKWLSPKNIVRNLTNMNKNLTLGRQHDASEFAIALVDRAQISSLRRSGKVTIQSNETGKCDVNKAAQHTTMIMRLLGGWTRSRVTWVKDQEMQSLRKNPDPKIRDKIREIETAAPHGSSFRSTNYEEFTVLGLNDLSGSSLEDCLEKYIESDDIEGFTTDRKGSVTCHKQVLIHKLPICLTLMLGRFQMDPFTGRLQKKSKRIKFRMALNMKPYCTEECLRNDSGLPLVDDPKNPGRKVHCHRYTLCGVVVHLGKSLRGGHYIAYVKAANGTWYECDDEEVKQVPADDVCQQEAFMLFYVVDPNLNYRNNTPSEFFTEPLDSFGDTSLSTNNMTMTEMLSGLSKREKQRFKRRLKQQENNEISNVDAASSLLLQKQQQQQQNQKLQTDASGQNSSSLSQMKQQISSTGAMMRKKAEEQYEDAGAEVDESEAIRQMEERKRHNYERLAAEKRAKEEAIVKQKLDEEHKEKKRQQQQIMTRKIQIDQSSHGGSNNDNDDDDNDDNGDTHHLAEDMGISDLTRNNKHQSQNQNQNEDYDDDEEFVDPVALERKARAERAEARRKVKERVKESQRLKKLSSANNSNTDESTTTFHMRGSGALDQNNTTFTQMIAAKKNQINNNNNNNDDRDELIPSDNDEFEGDELSPMFAGNKKKGGSHLASSSSATTTVKNVASSPSHASGTTQVLPQVSIQSKLNSIIKSGGDPATVLDEDAAFNDNHNVESKGDREARQQQVLRGADAAQALLASKEQRLIETGGKMNRKGYQGKFAKKQKDEQYNDEMDAGRQKKLRRDMTHARDAGLFASGQGPNRFQQVSEDKAYMKRQRDERDYMYGQQQQQPQGGRGRGGGGGRGGGNYHQNNNNNNYDRHQREGEASRMQTGRGFQRGHRRE